MTFCQAGGLKRGGWGLPPLGPYPPSPDRGGGFRKRGVGSVSKPISKKAQKNDPEKIFLKKRYIPQHKKHYICI